MQPSYARKFVLLVVLTLGHVACSNEVRVQPSGSDAKPDAASLATLDGGEASPAPALLCATSECQDPYTTCPDSHYLCDADLSRDPKHCGACAVTCPSSALNATSVCSDGRCRLVCRHYYGDCNDSIEDGCESEVNNDPHNCGTCGHACDEGVSCMNGQCGCGPDMTECDGKCVDLRTDDSNCGACDDVCSDPDGGAPLGPHAHYGCAQSKCGQFKCEQQAVYPPLMLWTDCDGDRSDGCEINVAADDANCTACGTPCDPGQTCASMSDVFPSIAMCACPPGLTECGGIANRVTSCVDLSTSFANCGACNVTCAQTEGCVQGSCVMNCPPGFADCNGDDSDGCEVDTDVDPTHCGDCATHCDDSLPQPCQEGRCATRPCDTHPVTR